MHLLAIYYVTYVIHVIHIGIQGNEGADEPANIGAALETLGPDLVPLIPHSLIKTKIREWSSFNLNKNY